MAMRAWIPSDDISGAVGRWFDPAYGVTLVSSAVSTWAARFASIANVDFAQPTPTVRPTYADLINGLSVLSHTAAQALAHADSGQVIGFSTVARVRATAYPATIMSKWANAVTNGSLLFDVFDASTPVRFVARTNGSNRILAITGTHDGSKARLYFGALNSGSPGTVNGSIDGNAPSSISIVYVYGAGSEVIRTNYRGGANNPGQIMLGDVIEWASFPSLGLRQQVEGFLAHKWGLTADLPSDHPYKTAAPEIDDGSGSTPVSGSGGATTTAPVTAGAGTVPDGGTGGATIAAPGTAGAATVTDQGTGGVTVPAPGAEAAGTEPVSGQGGADTSTTVGGSGGSPGAPVSGTGGATTSTTAAGAGSVTDRGTGAAASPGPGASGSGTVTDAGAGAAISPAPGAAGTGTISDRGAGGAAVPAPGVAGAGGSSPVPVSGAGEGTTSTGVEGAGTVSVRGAGGRGRSGDRRRRSGLRHDAGGGRGDRRYGDRRTRPGRGRRGRRGRDGDRSRGRGRIGRVGPGRRLDLDVGLGPGTTQRVEPAAWRIIDLEPDVRTIDVEAVVRIIDLEA